MANDVEQIFMYLICHLFIFFSEMSSYISPIFWWEFLNLKVWEFFLYVIDKRYLSDM